MLLRVMEELRARDHRPGYAGEQDPQVSPAVVDAWMEKVLPRPVLVPCRAGVERTGCPVKYIVKRPGHVDVA